MGRRGKTINPHVTEVRDPARGTDDQTRGFEDVILGAAAKLGEALRTCAECRP